MEIDTTISDFNFLEPGMSYEDVVERVGEPSDTTGSGILMFVYELEDGSCIVLNFGAHIDGLQVAERIKPDGTSEYLVE